jgi:hypothetical protein|tara:strand:- start:743 stop:1051 length:309 start_codon:yes stop_codon:yes gene_type:complete
MSALFDEELLEMDIKRGNMEERLKDYSIQYHTSLIDLLEARQVNDINKVAELTTKVYDTFKMVVSTNSWVINQNMEMVKKQLQDAFDRCGFSFDDFNEKQNG